MTTTMLNSNTLDEGLTALLADVHRLSMRARFYHWNVTGIWFAPLHSLFETHYDALAETEDLLAERLRALQLSAPFSMAELLAASTLRDDDQIPDAMTMLRQLLAGYEHLDRSAAAVQAQAEQQDDHVTADMLIGLLTDWQKSMWMLRAHLD